MNDAIGASGSEFREETDLPWTPKLGFIATLGAESTNFVQTRALKVSFGASLMPMPRALHRQVAEAVRSATMVAKAARRREECVPIQARVLFAEASRARTGPSLVTGEGEVRVVSKNRSGGIPHCNSSSWTPVGATTGRHSLRTGPSSASSRPVSLQESHVLSAPQSYLPDDTRLGHRRMRAEPSVFSVSSAGFVPHAP